MWQDNHWSATPNASNIPALLEWVDDSCVNNRELFHDGCTPMNGILRDMYRYFRSGWTRPGGSPTFATPLESSTTGERACRRVNVILVTDGAETCDGGGDAADAAAGLLAGWTAGNITWSVRTSVIDFGGGAAAQADAIAAAGGTGAAVTANNEAQLSQALANIITAGIQPEVCDNTDNNCNGCTDEGYRKFCNRGKTAVTHSARPVLQLDNAAAAGHVHEPLQREHHGRQPGRRSLRAPVLEPGHRRHCASDQVAVHRPGRGL